MNALDRLRQMLNEANIPYESYCRTYEDMKKKYPEWIAPTPECDADKYFENQIVYGRKEYGDWLFDAIFKYGSYGRHNDMVETYGEYGSDKKGNPLVMSAEEAFEIISRLERERKDK